MNNNDILRRVSSILKLGDTDMKNIFKTAGHKQMYGQVGDWLKKDEDQGYQEIGDTQMAVFLNGLINHKRGKKDGPNPEPEAKLTNNIIFMKLKIALDLKAEDVFKILNLSNLFMSNHELSALFRKPDNGHYRECKDEILDGFLRGLRLKFHPDI